MTAAAEMLEIPEVRARISAITVGQYWIILPTARRVEVHRQPEHGTYRDLTIPGYIRTMARRSFGM